MGARNGSQRVQPPPDPARPSQNLLAGQGLPARLSPTVTDTSIARTSLTRKRSLVQIQYGPRHFSKSCLALRATRGARLLRFCHIVAGQSTSRSSLDRRLSPAWHAQRRSIELPLPSVRRPLALARGYDTRSGLVIVVVETAGDDGDHVGLDVVHEPVLLGYPA